MVITFRGKPYTNTHKLGIELGVNPETLRVMYKRCERDKLSFNKELDKYLIERDKLNELIKFINFHYGLKISNKVELKKFFKEHKIKNKPYACSTEIWFGVIRYAIMYNYMWIIQPTVNFIYNGVEYSNFNKFIRHHRVISLTLYREIINNKGNLRLAILKCENDPEFGLVEKININGITYFSLREVHLKLGIGPASLRHLRREGFTYQEAYDRLKVNRRGTNSGYLFKFPISNGELTFESVEELGEFLGYSERRTRDLIMNLTEEEIFKLPKRDTKSYLFNGKQFSHVNEIEKYLGLGKSTLYGISKRLGLTVEEFINSAEEYVVYYKGKKHYTVAELVRVTNIHQKELTDIYKSVLQIKDIKERSKKFEDKINNRLKYEKFLTYNNNNYKNIYRMSKSLGVGYVTLKNNIRKKTTVEEFHSWLNKHLDKKKNELETINDG